MRIPETLRKMIEKLNAYYLRDYDTPYRSNKKLYAKAIYDNIAESPDELAFKKGDILNVIEQDTDGLEGWWLCSLRGRQGICPGNRLRIINSYDSGCFSPSPASSPCPSLGASTATLNSSILSSEIYENTGINGQQQLRQGKRRSWHITPHKVITPRKFGDVYLYDVPPSPNRSNPYQNLSIMSDPGAYDTPKPAEPVNYDCPKNWSKPHDKRTPRQDDPYDVPKPTNLLHQQNITPSSSNSSLLTSDSFSLSSSNRSSLAYVHDYDIPRRNPQPISSEPQQHSFVPDMRNDT